MATQSSILACRISWTEEPGGLKAMGLQRLGHDWATNIPQSSFRVLGHFLFYLCILFPPEFFSSLVTSVLSFMSVSKILCSACRAEHSPILYSAFWPNWTNPRPLGVAHSFLPPRPSSRCHFFAPPTNSYLLTFFRADPRYCLANFYSWMWSHLSFSTCSTPLFLFIIFCSFVIICVHILLICSSLCPDSPYSEIYTHRYSKTRCQPCFRYN